MPRTDLDIYMGGAKVGMLDGSDPRNLKIVYDPAWARDPRSTPLSVSMPLSAGTHSGATVEPYVWGLLPDNDRVLDRWASDYQVSARNVVALLRNVGNDVAGAAQYVPHGEVPEEATPGHIDPIDVAEVAALLNEVRTDSAAWHPRRQPGRWSLAGAQGKLALAYDAAADHWGVPSGSTPTTHILKPAIEGLHRHELNEHLCLSVARRVGLRAAFTQVRDFESEQAVVILRYDRVSDVDGRVIRVHQEDFCQALSVHPTKKYENEGGPSIEAMASLLRNAVVTDATSEIEALCRAVAFNWLVLGTDAHAKNYSLLLSGQQVRLAPLYDIASALPYNDHPRKMRLAQKVAGESRPAMVAARHWQRLARTVHVDADKLRGSIIDMIEQIPDALSDALDATPVLEGGGQMVPRLRERLHPWLASCRTAMG
jgi:serine/threonine-protein kinase HipA